MDAIFATPAALWAGLLAIPLLLLFMLRHRPSRMRVPSVVLWQGAAQMQVATSPFQRLRKSLSLLLLLCALAALVLALAGLRIPGVRARGTPIVVVVDVTASMGARELGGSRLELGVRRVKQLLDEASVAPVSVLAWDGNLRPASPPLTTLGRARESLENLGVVDYGARDAALADALQRLASEPGYRRLVLVSDHEPGTLDTNVVFVQAGTGQSNTAIVSAALTEVTANQQELFFGLEHFGPVPVRVSLAIERVVSATEGDPQDARDVDLVPGTRASVTVPVKDPGLYRARLRGTDGFALDDWACVRFSRLPVQEVVLWGNVPEPLKRAVAAIESASGSVRVVDPAAAGPDAMHIFAAAPYVSTRLPAVYLLPGAPPAGVTCSAPAPAGDAPARPARHALWRGAGVPDIRVAEVSPVKTDGFLQPLLEAGPGPALALLRRQDDSPLADLLVCCPINSDASGFAEKVAFVIFWENWFEAGRRLRDPLVRGAWSTRDHAEIPPLPGRGAFQYGLLGADEFETANPGDGLKLERAGVYEFRDLEGAPSNLAGASLLDADESNLADAGAGFDAGAASDRLAAADKEGERGDLPLYPWLALAAAALVLFEWFWFRRRFPVNRDALPKSSPSMKPRSAKGRA